jgi:hypothetical protein
VILFSAHSLPLKVKKNKNPIVWGKVTNMLVSQKIFGRFQVSKGIKH